MRGGLLARTAVPVMIAFAVLALGLSYVSKPAYVFDETYYFSFATGVSKWLAAPTLDEDTVGAVFYEGNYHPPLPLYAMALTTKLLQAERGDFLLAVRLATVMQFAALVVIVHLFVKREAGHAAGAFAAALTALSPRLFAHSLMATYDVPMTLWWVATTFAFYRGMTSRPWAVASGVIFGLALLTKVNAFLLPLALWPWGIYFHRRKSLAAIGSMCVFGPVVFFALWPWLWIHPVTNSVRYVADKLPAGAVSEWLLRHAGATGAPWRHIIPTLYFGKADPAGVPWHYPFVMLFMTMPLATLAGAAATAAKPVRGGEHKWLVCLVWWSVFVQAAVFAVAMKPYDGARLFLPALALVAIAGGIGLSWLARRGRRGMAIAAAAIALSPGAEFVLYEPYGMSYFTPVVGGLPGANALGMEATYYGEAVTPAEFAAISARAREGQTVAYAPMFKDIHWRMLVEYVRYGYLPLGLEAARETEDWDYMIFVNRGGAITGEDTRQLALGEVIAENRLLGVTLSEALARKRGEDTGGRDAPRVP